MPRKWSYVERFTKGKNGSVGTEADNSRKHGYTFIIGKKALRGLMNQTVDLLSQDIVYRAKQVCGAEKSSH